MFIRKTGRYEGMIAMHMRDVTPLKNLAIDMNTRKECYIF